MIIPINNKKVTATVVIGDDIYVPSDDEAATKTLPKALNAHFARQEELAEAEKAATKAEAERVAKIAKANREAMLAPAEPAEAPAAEKKKG